MGIKNQILGNLLTEINNLNKGGHGFVTNLQVVTDDATDYEISVVRRELEDDQLMAELKNICANTTSLAYNPFAIEFLVSDTIELLKSCLQKRTDLKNLEVTMLTDSVGKILAVKRRNYQNEILAAEATYPQPEKILSKQSRIKLSDNQLEADENSAAAVRQYEDAIKKLAKDYKVESEKYEDLLIAFSKDKKSGLNYIARYVELKEIYWDDVKEVFRKLKSVEVGLNTVYEMDTRLPEVTEENLLNKCYLWLKESLLKLSKLLNREQEFSIAISLKHGTATAPDGNMAKVLVLFNGEASPKSPKDIKWDEFLKAGNFSFNIMWGAAADSVYFQKKYRLKSISLQLTGIGSEGYMNIRLQPPSAKDVNSNEYTPPSLTYLCSVSRGTGDQTSNLSYVNTNPFNAWWKMGLSSSTLSGNDLVTKREQLLVGVGKNVIIDTAIDDIKLFMRIAVIL